MSTFHYKAVNTEGEAMEGDMDATVEGAVIARLQDAGYIPILVEPAARGRAARSQTLQILSRRRMSAREVELFTRELATLLRAGLPLDQSLQTLIEVSESDTLQHLVTSIYDEVRDGAAFSSALEMQSGAFSNLYINLVRAGESSGALDDTLTRLADYLQRVRDLREHVLSAITYPLILVVVAGISILVLLTFVIPQFSQMFADMGAALPLPTRIVMGAGDVLRSYWWAPPLIALAAAIAVRKWLEDPNRRLRWHRRMLRLPMVGDLVTRIEVARFTRTLGIMLKNGVPVLSALGIVDGSMRNRALADDVMKAAQSLEAGRPLAASLAEHQSFPKLAIKMIRVGEESGQLEEMLLRLGDVYDQEAQAAIRRLLSFLEPCLIVGLGLLIAGIIMSILVAVLGMNQLII